MKSLLAILLIPILFFSCSNVSEVDVVTERSETLKSVVANKENNVTWAKEIEGERLTKNIYSDNKYISDSFYLSPKNLAVSKRDSVPVYPEIPDFGSLDITDLPSSIKYIVDNFCEAVSDNIFQGPEQYFDEKYYFNYVFFKTDLINSWKKRFCIDFPVKSPEQLQEEAERLKSKDKSSDDIKDGNNEDIEIKQKPLFNKWIIGKPFTSSEIINIPVRFYCNQGFIDVALYINLDNNKIFQIVEGPYAGEK